MVLNAHKKLKFEGFSEYVSKFDDWIIKNATFGYRKVVLMLDNCPSHRSGDFMRLFKTWSTKFSSFLLILHNLLQYRCVLKEWSKGCKVKQNIKL